MSQSRVIDAHNPRPPHVANRHNDDVFETVKAYVGRGASEAIRERAVRIGLLVVNRFPDGERAVRPSLDTERQILERWLAAAPGSAERAQAVSEIPSAAASPCGTLLRVLVSPEPSHVAGSAAMHALRGYTMATLERHIIADLERALKAAGFEDLKEDIP